MDGITITPSTLVTLAELLAAVGAIFGIIFAVYRWYLRQNQQDEDIKQMKAEQSIITMGLLACLKGLSEQGCNGPVTEAIDKIERHLNERAHS